MYCKYKEDHISMERPHSHDGYELFFCLSGIRSYIVNDEILELQPASMVVVKPLVPHMPVFEAQPPYRRMLLVLEEAFVEEQLFAVASDRKVLESWFPSGGAPCTTLHFDARVMLKLQERLARIEQELAERPVHFEAAIKGLLIEIFIGISRSGENAVSSGSIRHKLQIEQILNELTRSFAEPFSADELARRVNLSRSHMDRMFKEATGCTPTQYLTAYRVNQAKLELAQSDRSVLEIAGEVGFGDLSHFYSTFKRLTGVTPKQYRNMIR